MLANPGAMVVSAVFRAGCVSRLRARALIRPSGTFSRMREKGRAVSAPSPACGRGPG
ncbi:hypothetical protein LG3211_0114 [Lysobacter gummosus]|nr:hypothetical protein LG3211_0114 [Lysobacter gummosus]